MVNINFVGYCYRKSRCNVCLIMEIEKIKNIVGKNEKRKKESCYCYGSRNINGFYYSI